MRMAGNSLDLTPGDWQIEVSMFGFKTQTATFTIRDQYTNKDWTLEMPRPGEAVEAPKPAAACAEQAGGSSSRIGHPGASSSDAGNYHSRGNCHTPHKQWPWRATPGAIAKRPGRNERCVHCYLDHDDHGEMTAAEIMDVLDQLAEAGVFFLASAAAKC